MIKPIIALRPYTRNGAFTLDSTSYYNHYNDAEAYARESPAAHPGQYIIVDDQQKRKVTIYRIVYSDPDSGYRYKLAEIGGGSASGGSGVVVYRGIVDSLEDLEELVQKNLDPDDPTILRPNDLYYVRTSTGSVPYIYTGNDEAGKSWEKVNIGVNLATEEQDGFITSEVFNTWISDEEGIFYTPGTQQAEDNKFIPLETVGTNDEHKMMTSDKIRSTIIEMIETDMSGEIEMTFNKNVEDLIDGSYVGDLTVYFNYIPHGDGDINYVMMKPVYATQEIRLDKSRFVKHDGYSDATIQIPAFMADMSKESAIEFTLHSDANTVTLRPSATISAKKTFSLHKQMCFEYGRLTGSATINGAIVYNLIPLSDKELTLKNVDRGGTYKCEIPAKKGFTYISFYTPYPIQQIVYLEGMDTEFLEHLQYETITDDTRFAHKYTMKGYPAYHINTQMSFEITF